MIFIFKWTKIKKLKKNKFAFFYHFTEQKHN